MNVHSKFEEAARQRRKKALLLAIVFHLAILCVIAISSGGVQRIIPDFVQELFSSSDQSKQQPIYP